MTERRPQEMSKPERLAEAAENILRALSGESELQVTESTGGDTRVRAYIPDEDGYAGWVENTRIAGVAQVHATEPPQYVGELHYPHLPNAGRPTYTYRFAPHLGEISMQMKRHDSGQAPLELPWEPDDDQLIDFLWMTRDVKDALRIEDYEFYARLRSETYQFELPELQ